MKSSKTVAVSLAALLAAAGALMTAAPAMASTVVGDGTFYGASDFGVETSSYPSGVDWFFGDAAGTDGPHAFTIDGLELNGDASGDVQILNQNVGPQPADAVEFIGLVGTLAVASDDATKWTYQIPMFAEGTTDSDFTTLRPNFTGNIDSGNPGAETWVTSQAFGSYAAGATDTLANFATAIFAGEAPRLLGYGLWVGAADTAVIQAIHWGDAANYFLPAPTRAISATTLTVDEAAATGITLTGTNWIPNSNIYVHIEDPDGDSIPIPATGTADAAGNVSVTVILAEPVKIGTYTVTFDDDDFYFDSDVFGDPFTTFEVTAPELAETGAPEAGALLGLAGLLAIIGAALVIGTRIRLSRS